MAMLPPNTFLAKSPTTPGLVTVKLSCGHAAHVSLNNANLWDTFPDGWCWCATCGDGMHLHDGALDLIDATLAAH